MPNDYTLSDLVKLTGTTPRTVRYYIAQGLLPSPTQQGPNARYSDVHLDRLRVIRKLQGAHLPLAEIRKQLGSLPADELATLAEATPDVQPPHDSALDYIENILNGRRAANPPSSPSAPAPAAATAFARSSAPAPAAARAFARSSAPALAPAPASAEQRPEPAKPRPAEPDRAQWERVVLDPDVELHIRRPLTRHQNKNVERLISIARQLLEE